MGYPYDKTYLQQIQESPKEMEVIRNAYWVLRSKYLADHPSEEGLSLSLATEFSLLGEAFELTSVVLEGCTDPYHFMWDILDELLKENEYE